jgi:nucleoside diphosphate kinase
MSETKAINTNNNTVNSSFLLEGNRYVLPEDRDTMTKAHNPQEPDNLRNQRTLIILKPDLILRNNIGKVLTMFEMSGFIIKGFEFKKMITNNVTYLSEELRMLDGTECMVIVLQRYNAISHTLSMCGAEIPSIANPGTIRHTFGITKEANSIYCSSNITQYRLDLGFFFPSGVDKPREFKTKP